MAWAAPDRPCRANASAARAAGWAAYGYCASHSRFFWGLRLYLMCTTTGMPILWALADAKIGEREVVAAMLDCDAELIAERTGLLLIADKGFAAKEFEADLARQGIRLLRPNRKTRRHAPAKPYSSRSAS